MRCSTKTFNPLSSVSSKGTELWRPILPNYHARSYPGWRNLATKGTWQWRERVLDMFIPLSPLCKLDERHRMLFPRVEEVSRNKWHVNHSLAYSHAHLSINGAPRKKIFQNNSSKFKLDSHDAMWCSHYAAWRVSEHAMLVSFLIWLAWVEQIFLH
jgi:hypothetical protein